jgi:predicted nucleic acid-binding protein
LSGALVIDTSAWARFGHPSLPQTRAEEIAEAVERGQLVVSLPFLLEAGYSARDARTHRELLEELLALPQVGIDEEVERRARAAQSALADVGHHRIPPVDLMIAALADRHGLGLLHYDADYELLLEHTNLHFESVWLSERGSL